MGKFQLPSVGKPLPGADAAADAFVRGGEPPLGAGQGAAAPAPAPATVTPIKPALDLVAPSDLPKSVLVRLTREQAQLIEMAFKALPYKTRKDMIEDVLFGELKRRIGV